MEEPLLMARLESLRNHLDVVKTNLESKAWESVADAHVYCRTELQSGSKLWKGLEEKLITGLKQYSKKLEAIEKDLVQATSGDEVVKAAWVRFGLVQRESQILLRECLEIIGSLAIRTKGLDQRTMYIADELIHECMFHSRNDLQYYLLVNSFEETLSRARARIIRLRFPEWTVWDLPLVGHELGHVAVNDILSAEKLQREFSNLTGFVETQRDSLIGSDSALNKKLQGGDRQASEAQTWAERRVRVLLADAFATYTLGPAYACSAIMLRLNPSAPQSEDLPSENQRAFVIIAMLRWMNDQGPVTKPYTDVIERLESAWRSTLACSNPDGELSDGQRSYLTQLAGAFAGESQDLLLSAAMYPTRGVTEGWKLAQKWNDAWIDHRKNNKEQVLATPNVEAGKLRDVLNASWLCRLELARDPRSMTTECHAIAKGAQDLCMAIIQTKPQPGGFAGRPPLPPAPNN